MYNNEIEKYIALLPYQKTEYLRDLWQSYFDCLPPKFNKSDRVDGWLSDLQEIQRTIGYRYAFEPSGSGEAYVADSESVLGEWPVQKGNKGEQPQMPSGSLDCELGNAEHIGSSAITQSRSNEETDGTERSAETLTFGQVCEKLKTLRKKIVFFLTFFGDAV